MSQMISEEIPAKRKTLEEHALVASQSPSMQNNIEDLYGTNKTDTSKNFESMNGSTTLTPIVQNSQAIVKKYRLIIQIDKIQNKPAPKCKKILPMTVSNDKKNTKIIKSEKKRKILPVYKNLCGKDSCKLKECTSIKYQSKPEFKCELCELYHKYYFAMKSQNYSCSKCSKSFLDPKLFDIHMNKTHFTCDICLTECSSQMSYDKHEKLHVNTDLLHPYKCHLCGKIFDLKDNVKQHYLEGNHLKIQNLQNTVVQMNSPIKTIVPQQTDYSCTNCNINFTSDQDYRNYTCSNGKETSITCNICSDIKKIISVPNPLTGSEIGILQEIKLSCRVCSKEFDKVKEIDLHTRTHLEVKNVKNDSFIDNIDGSSITLSLRN
ncbi:PREDICTED: zinc finger protein 652-like [Cyphomyrmex costatus]|uniref:zinc finger protein 652-like n=1 Tax=Cyphomyrmex costatus TaxID=456900 RepID=UPI0008521F1B|nr:PREDICTED: zinc finger protein 652-like [Cyphomyrmex costatus]